MSYQKTTKIWLSPSILDWEATTVSSRPNYDKEWKRAYEIWSHAEARLKAATSNEDRADVISILRRVLNHRIGRLRRFYLDKLSFIGKPAGAIEQLELMGIAKSTMVRNLLEIRNSIEYQDKQPPNKKRCSELLEFIWYFLKSTDPLVGSIAEEIEANKYDKSGKKTIYDFGLSYCQISKWKMRIYGDFESTVISLSEIPKWLEVIAEHIGQKSPCAEKVFKQNDLYIMGQFNQESAEYVKVCRFYFLNPGT